MNEFSKKVPTVLTAVSIGLTAGYVMARIYQKRREKIVGGKLMRVNYRFSKEFED